MAPRAMIFEDPDDLVALLEDDEEDELELEDQVLDPGHEIELVHPVPGPKPSPTSTPAEMSAKTTEPAENEVQCVATGSILIEPTDNYAKGGAPVLETAALKRTAERIRRYGLRHPLTVRRLASPITLLGETFSYRLVTGFRDFAAVKIAALEQVEARVVGNEKPERLILLNLAEASREEPTAFERAQGYHQARKAGVPLEDIAQAVGCSFEDVDLLERIITRAPLELVEVFRVDCSARTRRILERVCQIEGIDGIDGAQTRRLQLDAWAQMTASDAQEEEEEQEKAPSRRGPRTLGHAAIQAMRAKLLEAFEWQDPLTGEWRSIDACSPRELADALLFAICARRPCPLR